MRWARVYTLAPGRTPHLGCPGTLLSAAEYARAYFSASRVSGAVPAIVARMEPSWLSIMPAMVTITLAFLPRQVLLRLFCGFHAGAYDEVLG